MSASAGTFPSMRRSRSTTTKRTEGCDIAVSAADTATASRRHGWRGGRFFYSVRCADRLHRHDLAGHQLSRNHSRAFAIAALAFAMRHHRWHEYYDGPDSRDGYDPRDHDDFGRPHRSTKRRRCRSAA